MACLNFIFFASFKRNFRQLCTPIESKYNCSTSWWFSQQRWCISGKQTLMWIRIMGKTEGEEQSSSLHSIFQAHCTSPQSHTTVTLLNNEWQNEKKIKEQQARERRFELTFAVRGSHREVPSGCSRWLQLFWPDYLARTELQWGKQKGTGRRKGAKAKTSTENRIWSLQAASFWILWIRESYKIK